MCKVVEENPQESVPTSSVNQSVGSVNLSKNILSLETICEEINHIFSPGQANPSPSEQHSQAEQINVSGTISPSAHQDDGNPTSMVESEMMDVVSESKPQSESSKLRESDPDPAKEKSESSLNVQAPTDPSPPQVEGTSLPDVTGDDVMDERKDGAASNGSNEKSEPGVIVLDD